MIPNSKIQYEDELIDNNGTIEKIFSIDKIIDEYLIKIRENPEWGAWLILYKEKESDQYWELDHPQGEYHGGGGRRIRRISFSEAKKRYQL